METLERMEDQSATYTVEEAARLLRIGRSAAYIACSKNQIPTIRLGRKLRVPRAALEKLLQTGMAPVDAA